MKDDWLLSKSHNIANSTSANSHVGVTALENSNSKQGYGKKILKNWYVKSVQMRNGFQHLICADGITYNILNVNSLAGRSAADNIAIANLAAAAPDLLAAAHSALLAVHCNRGAADPTIRNEAEAKLRAAIAKAEGNL